jgi:chromosome segregation protein
MYFKKLELIGFKSFADRTTLDFEPGITVIVGPNGCGKSNISDAIRWVLGEQSARLLRGQRMEDVIFSGTDDKKAQGMAEVSLTLAEADKDLALGYNEVTVTRRVFRSGESEYLINKTPCRMKDINDLFMGTGIGTDAYSVIEQGKIDLVLSSKPEERRYIFEEAAGITKYKSRKREALRKIEYTEENLIRLNDILKEVKRQINSINRYANKAREYKEVHDELKELDLRYNLFKYRNMRAEADLAAREMTVVREHEASLNSAIEGLEDESSGLRDGLEEIEGSIASFERDLLAISDKINRYENEIVYNNERLRDFKILEENSTKEIEALREDLKVSRAETARAEGDLAKIREVNAGIKEQIQEKQELVNRIVLAVRTKEEQLAKNKEEAFEVLASDTKARNELSQLRIEKKNLALRREKLQVEKQDILGQIERIESQTACFLGELEAEENDVRAVRAEGARQNGLRDALAAEIARAGEELSRQRDVLAEKKADVKLQVELKERFEGYNPGVKAILESKKGGRKNGVIGPLADFIEIRPGYEIPVQLALSGEVQDIITDDVDSIRDHIHALKERDDGRASFIPLIEFKYRIKDAPRRKDLGRFAGCGAIKGFVTDFISCKENYREILEFLFRDTVIVDEFESAFELIKEDDFDFNVVTVTGEYIGKNRVMRGGRVPKEEISILRRDNVIEALKGEIVEREAALERLSGEKAAKEQGLESLEREREAFQAKLNRLEVQLATKKTDCDKLRFQKDRLSENHTVVVSEIKELFEEDGRLAGAIEALAREIERNEQANVTLKCSLTGIESAIGEDEKQKDGVVEAMTALKIELASSEEKEYNIDTENKRLVEELTSKDNLLRTRTNDLAGYKSKQIDLAQAVGSAEEDLSSLRVQKDGIVKYVDESKEKKKALAAKLSEYDRGLKERRASLAAYAEKRLRHELKVSEFKMRLGAMSEYVRKEYHAGFDELALEIDENANWEEVELKIDELKARIEKMGPVNLAAIEENEELEKRYNFLLKQHEDLVQAKDSLLKVISKINTTTRQLFMDTFAQIRTNFQEMFVRLFGGGKADLIMMDEGDVLETGIEIVARPPGKKLQNVSLLSGGEKALTAVSLLFAIFKVKPSPFCVLDEIDAPLDESNIGRFIDCLKEFTKNSQFITVTHNKKTISAADIMYGITMEQHGISKVVSVRFAPKRDRLPKEEQQEAAVAAPPADTFSRGDMKIDDDLKDIDQALKVEIAEPSPEALDKDLS